MPEIRQVRFRVQGELACFTRPELKVERVSYEVMTPAAARGVLESVFRKPEMFWEIRSIAILNPIQTVEFRRNEVKSMARANRTPFYIQEERTQRNTVALRDVDYVVTAALGLRLPLAERADHDKYENMFYRRLRAGQGVTQAFLGCREFIGHVSPAPDHYKTFDEVGIRELGGMHYDFNYEFSPPLPMVFRARLDRGVLHVPTRAEVMAYNNILGDAHVSRSPV